MSVYHYVTQGTCSRSIDIELDGKTIKRVAFEGGCPGNLSGIARLVEGMDIDQVISRFSGNRCGNRPTSCPDQLARALTEAYEAGKTEVGHAL